MEKPYWRSVSTLLMGLLILGFYFSCTSAPVITHTAEEISLAQQAVIKVMEITVVAGAESFETQWEASAVNIVPIEASEMLASIESIPGLRMQLELYLQAMQSDTALIATQILPFLTEMVFPTLTIEEPFSLIDGNSDAVTRFFASRVSPPLEAWIAEKLSTEELKGMETWNELTRTYNMYVKSRNLLNKNPDKPDKPLLTANPVHVVTVAIIRQLLEVMKVQEALLRSMAPAYEDPLIALFSAQ